MDEDNRFANLSSSEDEFSSMSSDEESSQHEDYDDEFIQAFGKSTGITDQCRADIFEIKNNHPGHFPHRYNWKSFDLSNYNADRG